MDKVVEATGVTLTADQIRDIKRAFGAMDLNHDGRISENELQRACKKLGILATKTEITKIKKQMDKDGNGTIDYREFENFVGHQLVIANYKNKYLMEEFRRFDIDGDGYITAEEIRRVFKETGVDLTDDDVNDLIAEADENGDGVISFEEFVNSVCEKDW